jgi:hypothetical protein
MTTPLIDEMEILKKLENAIFARYKDLNADLFSAEIYHTIIEPLYETPLYQGTGGHNYIQDEDNEETTNRIEEIVEELSILSMERISPYTATTRDFKASAMEIVKAYGDQRAEEERERMKKVCLVHGCFCRYGCKHKCTCDKAVQEALTPPNTTEL